MLLLFLLLMALNLITTHSRAPHTAIREKRLLYLNNNACDVNDGGSVQIIDPCNVWRNLGPTLHMNKISYLQEKIISVLSNQQIVETFSYR